MACNQDRNGLVLLSAIKADDATGVSFVHVQAKLQTCFTPDILPSVLQIRLRDNPWV